MALGLCRPIHDHRGSACAFRVLAGECRETIFEAGDGSTVQPVSSRLHLAGAICTGEDLDVHKVENAGESDLVTLHIYSPPLWR